MEKRIGSYETLIVINAALPEEEIKALVDKFTALVSANGTMESVDEWGKRRLAYPIDDLTDGYFVVLSYKSPADFPAEIERVLGVKADTHPTEDGLFSISGLRCVGACGLAPVMMVNGKVYGKVTPAQAVEIVKEYKAQG